YGGRRRVLYVEDNPVNAEVMRGVMAQRPQIDLIVCDDGSSGLEALQGDALDLVLLDLLLPDMDGFEWLARARAAGASMPVVMVSASALGEHVERAHAAGVHAYLPKPIDVAALLAMLDALLAGEQESP
ncbi:MAG TPA: response regulator, partial [Burkholderiaceae bacterium]